jgi:hypothetical protein
VSGGKKPKFYEKFGKNRMWWVEWEKKTLAVFFFLLNIPEFFFSFP